MRLEPKRLIGRVEKAIPMCIASGANLFFPFLVSIFFCYFPDSTSMLLRSNSSPTLENEGAISVTARRRFQARHSQELLVQWSLNGRIESVSASSERYLGTAPGELLGEKIENLIVDSAGLDFGASGPFDSTPDNTRFLLRNARGQAVEFEGHCEREGDSFLCLLRPSDQMERCGAELQALLSLAREINARHTPAELVARLSAHLKPFISFDNLFLSFLNDQGLQMVASSGEKPYFPFLERRKWNDHPIWQILDKGWMWSENDFKCENNNPATTQTVRAFINVPLMVENRAIGVLHFDAFSPRRWSENELRLARFVGEQVAAVVEGAELLRQHAESESALAQSLALLRATQEAAAEGICLVNEAGELVSYNRRFAQLWQISPTEEADLAATGQLMSAILQKHADPDEFLLKIGELYENPRESARDEVILSDGRTFERYSAPALAPDGRSFGRIWTFDDISERKRAEQQLAHQAFYDVVTGLPNRVLLSERLRRALTRLGRSSSALGVLFLDLDRFKVVNDSLGHEKGDQLLAQVAARLQEALRPGDTAARFGGDEFVVLLEEIQTSGDATRIADRISQALAAPFHLGEHEVGVTVSIGIVFCEGAGENAEDLLRKADIAMYRAKNGGKAQYQIFSETTAAADLERLQLEIDLASALKRGEIEVFYQPLMDLNGDRISAFEALVRWNHPRFGLVCPAQFVPLAEETGHIFALGAHVLRVACEQAQLWSEKWAFPVLMHVNLSVRQFETCDLSAQIARVLAETELPGAQLVLEITESMLMRDAHSATRQLHELKTLGVKLAIDDFGTGYSSLAYIERFPLDMLKIDRAFVARLGEGSSLVRAVTSLGQALGLEVVAEGIETLAQFEAVRALGCRWGQGFLFSRPLPAAEAEVFMAEFQIATAF